jgi:hypothetical protein
VDDNEALMPLGLGLNFSPKPKPKPKHTHNRGEMLFLCNRPEAGVISRGHHSGIFELQFWVDRLTYAVEEGLELFTYPIRHRFEGAVNYFFAIRNWRRADDISLLH